ncbi:MAG: hypothetical protein AAF682_29240 [Planctomycetota bacterium]
MKTLRTLATPLAGALLAGGAAAQFSLTEIALIDLDSTANALNPEYIGSNPSAVAWDGTDLFVAGYNNQGTTDFAGIVKVSGALSSPTFGVAFGVLSTPSLRGYSGLDVSGGVLAAAYDPGSSDPNGITAWDLNGGQLWARDARGGSGTGFDPGFPGGTPALGAGVGWTTFGSGRRALQDTASGADIYTTSDGMVILSSEGTFWRDMDYDDATGDVWLREGNNVIHAVRSGDNAVSTINVTVDVNDQDFINGQNLAFIDFGLNDWIIYNDRDATAPGQDFFAVNKAIRPDGSPVTLSFFGTSPPVSAAYYDYSWDPASQTLAVLDFSNRNVHIYAVVFDCGGAVLATETVRLGTPANPNALLPGATSGPVIGQIWDPVIAPFLSGAILDFMGISPGTLNLPSPIGTILCNPPAASLTFTSAGGAPFAVPIPPDCGLAGAALCAQGGQLSAAGVISLTNALDIVLGTL